MQHSRKPWLLADSEFGEFTLAMDEFFLDDRSMPNRPDHLVADIASKGLLFRQKLDEMNAALATRKTASNLIESSVKSMDGLIRWAKNILPTLADESILLPFGLDRDIPRDYAAIKDYADTVDVYWQTVKLEPLYAPVALRMNELATLIAAYETGRADQTTADGEYSQRQNEKDIARADYNEIERRAFNWYAAYYTDGQDIYWEQTPWGKAYSESGGGEEPEPEPGVEGVPWPGPMAGFEVNLIALPLTTEIIFTRIFDCPKCVLERELEGSGMWEFITEYDLEEEEILPFRDNVPHPGKWHYRATPFNAVGEVGVVSEGSVEVV